MLLHHTPALKKNHELMLMDTLLLRLRYSGIPNFILDLLTCSSTLLLLFCHSRVSSDQTLSIVGFLLRYFQQQPPYIFYHSIFLVYWLSLAL